MVSRRGTVHGARLLALLACAGAFALTGAAVASAARVTGGPIPLSYQNPNITIDQGEEVTFINLDVTAPHDVTSTQTGPGFQPLFRSETISFPNEVPVVGAERLGPGRYPFICSIHPSMTGSITVRGQGGGGGGADRTAPRLRIRALDTKARRVRRRGALRIAVRVSEPSNLRLRATARNGRVTVARGEEAIKKGKSRVAARLTRQGKRLLKRSRRTRIEIVGRAEDGPGNRGRARDRVTLR